MVKGRGFVLATMLVIGLLAALQVTMATEYIVGGSTGWDFAPTPTFFTDWAARIDFLPGDKLVFKYLPSEHVVQEVNHVNYKICSGMNPIKEYHSGDDVITLSKRGTYHFICGYLGHCDGGGMLMKVTVGRPHVAPNPELSPSYPRPPSISPVGSPNFNPLVGPLVPPPSSGGGSGGNFTAPDRSSGKMMLTSMSFGVASVAVAVALSI